MESLSFDFYGVAVRVTCDDAEVRTRILEDFRYFLRPESSPRAEDTCHLSLRAFRRAPDYAALPPIRATIYSPRNICYTQGDITYIDYFGGALSIYHRRQDSLEVFSEELHLLHEILFLTILSRVGEKLEQRGMHRVHALAVERNRESALFLLPSGGGKTTLGMGILRRDLPYRLMSEDSPLVTASGDILPFPLRFGIVAKQKPDVPPEFVTYLERMEFEPKYLISLRAFEGRISPDSAAPQMIFIGERTLAPECKIRRASHAAGIKALLRHMVIGVGLYQGVEFLLQSSVADLVGHAGIFLSRMRAAAALLRHASVFVVELGRFPEQNLATVLSFLDSEHLGARA